MINHAAKLILNNQTDKHLAILSDSTTRKKAGRRGKPSPSAGCQLRSTAGIRLFCTNLIAVYSVIKNVKEAWEAQPISILRTECVLQCSENCRNDSTTKHSHNHQ